MVKANQTSLAGAKLPWAEPGTKGQYLFADGIHPSDVGHQALAELLAGVVRLAVQGVAAAPASSSASKSSGSSGSGDDSSGNSSSSEAAELPPPMIPGNVDSPTSLCAMQVGSMAERRRRLQVLAVACSCTLQLDAAVSSASNARLLAALLPPAPCHAGELQAGGQGHVWLCVACGATRHAHICRAEVGVPRRETGWVPDLGMPLDAHGSVWCSFPADAAVYAMHTSTTCNT